MTCERSGLQTTVVFTASDTIQEFHRPEMQPGKVLLRFPGVSAASDIVQSLCSGISIQLNQIREFLVVKLDVGGYQSATIQRRGPRSVVLTILGTNVTSPPGTDSSHTVRTAPSNGTWSLDVIVLDAGHGGKDVGAIGVNGAYEKDVTLSIARKVRDLLKVAMPATQVVMTRDDDVFVELYRRTQIANDAKGKLFISIHCNSMPTIPHPAHGCETYILRPGRNEDAARVAERENASIKLENSAGRYSTLDADQLIVATMAQRSFVRYSEALASKIQKHVSSSTPLTDRGVNQAGFYVLVGASMPNVLFETAFLSNPEDAEFVSSASGQNKIAAALLEAIKEFAQMYNQHKRE